MMGPPKPPQCNCTGSSASGTISEGSSISSGSACRESFRHHLGTWSFLHIDSGDVYGVWPN